MFELRFFEIYRSEEYILLLLEGIGISTALTIGAGAMVRAAPWPVDTNERMEGWKRHTRRDYP